MFVRDLLCAGELNVDLILTGVTRLPEFGQEVLASAYDECMGSSSAICACGAGALGLQTAFFGKLGDDRFGEIVLNTLRQNRVETDYIEVIPAGKTGLTFIASASADRAMFTCFRDSIDAFAAEEVPLEASGARHLHVSSFFLLHRLRPGLPALFARAHELGMTTSLDTGWDDSGAWDGGLRDVFRHTDFFFPNEVEAAAITGADDPLCAAEAIARLGCNAVVKCGAEGAAYCGRECQAAKRFPGYRAQPVDTTGAGDSFNAGFLYGYLNGFDLEKRMACANAAGALSVARPGGASRCATVEEVERTIVTGIASGM